MAAVQHLSFGDVSRHALSILRLHPLGYLATSFVVVFVPSLWGNRLGDPIADALAPEPPDDSGDDPGEILRTAIDVLPDVLCAFGTVLLVAIIVHAAVARQKGLSQSFASSLLAGLRDYPKCALAATVIALIAAASSLLIFPAFIVTSLGSLALPVIVAERLSIGEAFARSRHLTEGHRWAIVGWALPLALLWGASDFLQNLDYWFDVDDAVLWTLGCLGAVVQMALSLAGSAGLAAIYAELRWIKDGAGSAATIAAFD